MSRGAPPGTHTNLWGRVARRDGCEVTMTMETPEGYNFTVISAVRAAESVIEGRVATGSLTPARAFGADFVRKRLIRGCLPIL